MERALACLLTNIFAYMIDTKFGELTLGQGQLNHRMHVARCALLGPTRTPQVRTPRMTLGHGLHAALARHGRDRTGSHPLSQAGLAWAQLDNLRNSSNHSYISIDTAVCKGIERLHWT